MTAPFDLQAHSLHSDGALGAGEVVARAAAAGVTALALSDHDTVGGVDEAIAAGAEHGVRIVPAVEISAVDPGGEDLHILGYGVDHHDPAFLRALERFRGDRGRRADRMADRLRELGWAVDERPLSERHRAGLPIGRPHLAAAVVGHPANAERLARERLASSSDLLVAYLIPGAPAYRGRETPTVAEAIAAIHDAGGLAVWAHPFWDIDADLAVVATLERFAGLGLDGVEAFYLTFNEAQTRLLVDAARRLGLVTTGSSDFHGPAHELFSTFGSFPRYGLAPNVEPVLALAR